MPRFYQLLMGDVTQDKGKPGNTKIRKYLRAKLVWRN